MEWLAGSVTHKQRFQTQIGHQKTRSLSASSACPYCYLTNISPQCARYFPRPMAHLQENAEQYAPDFERAGLASLDMNESTG
jgi:hypothetical protein